MYRKIYTLNDNEIVTIEEQKHHNENDFQELIANHPELIPGEQIDPENPRRWILVGREINKIDVLLLDQDGIPTVVEVKKSINLEIHREVSAQLLDYGANLFRLSVDRIISKIDSNDLQDFLGESISEEEFWINVHKNLEMENMRLIVVSDHIPQSLQNILEFLNNKISIEVFTVEIKQYTDNKTGIRTFVPKISGHSRDMLILEPELNENTLYDNLNEIGIEFYRELLCFAYENDFNIKWTKNGFFLTVPIGDHSVKVLHCYSKLYSFGQSVFSTRNYLIKGVNNGDLIFKKYLGNILEFDGFYRVSDGFGYKLEKNFSEAQWSEFKNILLEARMEIETNSLVN